MFPKTTLPVTFSIVVFLTHFSSASDFQKFQSQNWHQWRGPNANGFSSTVDPPVTWSEHENILWKVAIDGHGNSTPIVWGDKVFLLTAIDTGWVDPDLTPPDEQPDRPFGIKYPNTYHQYVVLCLDRNTGQELWRRIAGEKIPQESITMTTALQAPRRQPTDRGCTSGLSVEWPDESAFNEFIQSQAFRDVTNWGKEQILSDRPRHKIYKS